MGKRMNIGICDDEFVWREKCYNLCKKYIDSNDIKNIEIFVYENGKELLDERNKLDLIFLDIELPDINGIEIKNIFEEKEIKTVIYFITNYSEYVKGAFGVNVGGFIDKPLSFDKISDCIAKEITRCNRKKHLVEIGKNDYICEENIMYIESYGREIHIHTVDDKRVIKKSIGEFESILSKERFVRVHKSYIVNMMYIHKFGTKAELKDGTVVSIGRVYKKNAVDTYNTYIKSVIVL